MARAMQTASNMANRKGYIQIKNKHGDVIKEVPSDFSDPSQYTYPIALLEDAGINNFNTAESMNTASIKSAIKELLGDGGEVPLELFGAHFARKAVVK